MPKLELKPRVKVDQKRRILIPKWMAEQLSLNPGDIFEIEVYDGKILLTLLGERRK